MQATPHPETMQIMSQLRPQASPAEELSRDFVELANLIHSLPDDQRRRLEPVFDRVAESARRRRRILNLVQEALSQLRLDMKYLLFDLEATRRERDAFRKEREDEQS
jgi:hypothetical protein